MYAVSFLTQAVDDRSSQYRGQSITLNTQGKTGSFGNFIFSSQIPYSKYVSISRDSLLHSLAAAFPSCPIFIWRTNRNSISSVVSPEPPSRPCMAPVARLSSSRVLSFNSLMSSAVRHLNFNFLTRKLISWFAKATLLLGAQPQRTFRTPGLLKTMFQISGRMLSLLEGFPFVFGGGEDGSDAVDCWVGL